MKILIVDDSNDARKMLCTVLRAQGHEVLEAVNGREGLQAASSHRLDLIISDVLMPVMDGFQFLHNLRKTSSVPFVFYSAVYDGNKDIQLATSLGADGYLIKPMDPLELLEKIGRIAAKGGQERSGGEDETEYLERYSQVVAAKLEEKVRELELDIAMRKKAEEEREELRGQLIQAQKMDSIGRLAGGVAHDFNNMLGVVLGYAEISLDQTSPDNPLFTNLLEIRNAAERSADLTRQMAGVEPAVTERSVPSAVPGSETILLVEDEPALLKMISLVLNNIGFRVLAASSPAEAIRLADEHAGDIQLLLTDVIMPGMNGVDLAKELNALYPEIKQLFMSGYTGDVVVRQDTANKNINFIQKPFSLPDLAAKTREVLDGVCRRD